MVKSEALKEVYGDMPPEVRLKTETFRALGLDRGRELFNGKRARKAYKLGVIPEALLQDGAWYWGVNRNCNMGQWDAAHQRFNHYRYKWGNTYSDTSNCLENDDGFALFFPFAPVVPEKQSLVQRAWNAFLLWCYQ
jgi:hypothetical protein